MALNPILSIVQSNGNVTISDATVYGGGEDERGDVDVTFSVTLKKQDGDESVSLPSYDSGSVVSIGFTPSEDGYYSVTMTIAGTATLTETDVFFRSYSLESCLATKQLAFYSDCDSDDDGVIELLKIAAAIDMIDLQVANGIYDKAQCILEGINVLCEDVNQNCCD